MKGGNKHRCKEMQTVFPSIKLEVLHGRDADLTGRDSCTLKVPRTQLTCCPTGCKKPNLKLSLGFGLKQ